MGNNTSKLPTFWTVGAIQTALIARSLLSYIAVALVKAIAFKHNRKKAPWYGDA